MQAKFIIELPQKIQLKQSAPICLLLKNSSEQAISHIIINPANLMIDSIIEERETRKSIEEINEFTFAEFNKIPRDLKRNHFLRIKGLFIANELGLQSILTQIHYKIFDDENKLLEKNIMMDTQEGAVTEVVS